jgi:Flp pilus assembly protein TadG
MTLVLGLLLSLTFGAVEFGHYFFVKNTLQGAAREGARAAIPAAATNADVQVAVNNSLKAAGFSVSKYTIKIRNAADTADVNVATQPAGAGILVRVSGAWGTVGIRPMGMIDAKNYVKGAAVMRKEST